MKCQRCGAWSDVSATRPLFRGFATQRTRVCANGHRFHTYEIGRAALGTVRSRLRDASITAERRALLYKRNAEIARRLAAGEQGKHLAAEYGLSTSSVSLINRARIRESCKP